ncbi:putative fungal pheromone GPCR, STE3-type [Mycena maculata]|uniref:Fungal pheromone GPCR, STE3-type n=1 Tax=Mycena maculata TaxID=230809 RepID=A0AAD7NNZ1_9AGAR|nr:putative fungal pheromone GPCR, STE3-type [Mycena maculata]
MHYELPIGAFIASFIVLIPLPWHWRARNVPTLSLIAWLFISNMIYAIDAVIWAGNIDVVAEVWCDIATKLQVGSTMGLPTCCLCLCIHLERIASVRQVRTTPEQKRRRMIFDLLMCWGLPCITMALHYVVQGHRFDIVEDLGCRAAIYVSIASIFLVWLPPIVVVILTLGFASAALYHFFRRRLTFARHLQAASSLTPSRYFRLMAMALAQMMWATIVTAADMAFTLRPGLRPWISWANVHSDFGRVGVFPTAFIPAQTLLVSYLIWWTVPLSALLFAAFFAFGEDAKREYSACWHAVVRVVKRVLRRPSTPAPVAVDLPTLPTDLKPRSQCDSEFDPSETETTDAESQYDHRKGTFDIPLAPASETTFGSPSSTKHWSV